MASSFFRVLQVWCYRLTARLVPEAISDKVGVDAQAKAVS
jgi:hypothetical protein